MIHCFLHRPNSRITGVCGRNHHRAPVRSLKALISVFLPGKRGWFGFAVFSHGDSSSNFHLFSPTIIVPIPQKREPVWRSCQFLSVTVPIVHSGSGEITTGCIQQPAGPTVNQIFTKTPLIICLCKPVREPESHNSIWSHLESIPIQSHCVVTSLSPAAKLYYFLYPEQVVMLLKECTFL